MRIRFFDSDPFKIGEALTLFTVCLCLDQSLLTHIEAELHWQVWAHLQHPNGGQRIKRPTKIRPPVSENKSCKTCSSLPKHVRPRKVQILEDSLCQTGVPRILNSTLVSRRIMKAVAMSTIAAYCRRQYPLREVTVQAAQR